MVTGALERLFRAYFSEGLLASDHGTLTSLARDIGIADAGAMLSGQIFADSVRTAENWAARIGITAVPTMTFKGPIHVAGELGVEAMLRAFESAWTQDIDDPV